MHCLPFLTSGVFRILETVGWSTEMRSDRATKDENVTSECTASWTFFVGYLFSKILQRKCASQRSLNTPLPTTLCWQNATLYNVQWSCACVFFLFLFVNLQTRKESHIAYCVGLTILFFCLFSGGVMAFIQCCCNVLRCSDLTVGL